MRRQPQPATTSSFQTVRLKRGKHVSPEHGVCVMELASMLAGERFSDHPRSVSPVIGAFLRAYNDLVDDDRRQDLYRFAADSVGTRAPRAIESARGAACREWVAGIVSPGFRRPPMAITPRQRRIWNAIEAARQAARRAERHEQALALVERLIALGRPERAWSSGDALPPPVAPEPPGGTKLPTI